MPLSKLYIRTFGCQMNEYDSQKMIDVLKHSHGLALTDNALEADVLLLNTCSIREKAQEKLFHQLGRWRKFKEKNPNLIIGVGGCVASQEGELILKRAPFVDIIFGPQTLHRLPNMLSDALSNKQTSIDISFPEIEKFDYLPEPKTNGVTAFVSIMEGCSKYCTFCVVPYTRGEEVSRPFNDVINEVQILANQGVREVNLLGQNVNAYQGKMTDEETADLALLINIVAQIDGIDRIRYTTSHPVEFSERLIQAYAEVPELVSHLHLPIQSGSDRILTLMKRGHTTLEYKSKIRRLREVRPDISISSDFIIGFPGENEQDFADTMALINDISFDKSFSFIYSARPGTPASTYTDDVTLKIKKERLALVQKTIDKSTEQISKAMIGSVQKVLVENKAKKGDNLFGRTENMRNTHFKGDESLIGQIVNVKITDARANSLMGEVEI
ncbi:tRNA-i(6)A37 methylthiotransferase [uncultured Gammaproteobacteria bacterium]|uniref:tRNA (N6-isopentenyl adenosine(37)-C2)-methylthiotransferase MiaB n=1 Tax=thiotrophic endosymbiont of Bathymodiolus puteoserpentis (Logatchev) TaxID=343240 RepID=UPI0010B5A637|nr:tRNA (N6-isopentenyl adenosine(37)-C2)-methylthiotransferase MiaB [thiotrophic endosymbiont of Bathymodiolus puteoserpentis (Logatchev)]CAC9488752.1 tRNA-i(6)A37 methylthiotransferase (EC 2.8.4.3) [uncultured Gammaproteobacteria bacterium]CAC9582191.1 tRNA-i(6)A37 methylthiotransferase (EC 2.8.4.3) [uncultured Gammaproteobacteria bacterium]CAC9589437.1 tRNA-i(6)A37 methylthiotransferase (EC 2.8.4.3) [uncultured Gammaproteobacteria bacterium]CAC9985426.1 tRNA-i(6)A37 methylthiotransferase (EC